MIHVEDKKKLLFISPSKSGFIKNDFDFLSKEYNVIWNHYHWEKKLNTPWLFLLHFLFLLRNIFSAKGIVVQFGGYWSFLPVFFGKTFNKPAFIVLHGTDCASIPDLNYGMLRKPILNWFCKQAYFNATRLLPVSNSLIETQNEYRGKLDNQGYKYHFPSIKTPSTVIPNGLNTAFWTSDTQVLRDENKFIAVFSDSQFFLKGGDLILKAAQAFPKKSFFIAGCSAPPKEYSTPKNVKFLGRISHADLRNHYRTSSVHFQLSSYEGFGLALCEAMLCGCIPIGSNVNSIPEIIGEEGFVLEKANEHALEALITTIFSANNLDELRERGRKRILENYSLEKRETLLMNTIKSHLQC